MHPMRHNTRHDNLPGVVVYKANDLHLNIMNIRSMMTLNSFLKP